MAVSLLHRGKGRTSEDLKRDKQPPALDQDLESNWIFQERVQLLLVCAHRARNEQVLLYKGRCEFESYGLFLREF